MSFWVIFVIIIVVLGWLDQFRTGQRDAAKHTSEKTRLRKGTSPLPFASKDDKSDAIGPPLSVLSGVNQALDTVNNGFAKRLEVEKATKQLQGDVNRERILIDCALKIAETRFRTEEARRQMSPTQRRTYDLTGQRLAAALAAKDADQGEQAVEYRRPIFSFPEGSYSDEVALAIREKIGALQEERATYVAAVNNRVSGTELGRYFVEAFERLGGPQTAQSLRTAQPIESGTIDVDAGTAQPQGARDGGLLSRTELLAGRNSKVRMSAISLNSLIGSNASGSEGSASLSAFSPEDISKTFDTWRRASAIKAQAEAIGIPYLVHFTDLANLPTILEKGLGPVAELGAAGIPFRANDRLRLDGHTDAVSLSIGHPNDKMFAKYRWQDAERRWVVLVLKPSILWTLPVAFNRHNAADKRVSSSTQDQRMTSAAFDGMFATSDDLPSREESNLLSYDPTDVQAELLVFATIPAQLITGIVFDSAVSEASHQCSSGERRSTIEPGSSGFFAARSYARKVGWTY